MSQSRLESDPRSRMAHKISSQSRLALEDAEQTAPIPLMRMVRPISVM